MLRTDKTATSDSHPRLPRITIIVAVLNAAKTLERCLLSITEQNYSFKELIVMDGGSTDGSINILHSYSNNINYWESEADKGIYHAWNKALKHATGEWICFLGADDYFWDKHVLSNIAPYLIRAENCGTRVVYGRIARVDTSGKIIKFIGKPWEKIRWLMPHGMPLPHPGLMHQYTLFKENGLFDETFQIAADYELLLRELRHKQALYAPDIIVAGWQSGGISEYKVLDAHNEVLLARKKNGLNSFSWVWWVVHIRNILRSHWQKFTRS